MPSKINQRWLNTGGGEGGGKAKKEALPNMLFQMWQNLHLISNQHRQFTQFIRQLKDHELAASLKRSSELLCEVHNICSTPSPCYSPVLEHETSFHPVVLLFSFFYPQKSSVLTHTQRPQWRLWKDSQEQGLWGLFWEKSEQRESEDGDSW